MANTRIERVLRHDGIVAVLDWSTDQPHAHEPHQGPLNAHPPQWVGDERWHPIVHEAVKLRQISGETSVRVLVGDHAVLVSGDEGHVVGVVFIKGHPVVKSVVRMVRQLLRPPGGSASKSSGKGGAASRPPKDAGDLNERSNMPRPPGPPGMNPPMGGRPMGMPPGPMGMPPGPPPMPMGMHPGPGMNRGAMGVPPGGAHPVPPGPPLVQPGGPAANQGPGDPRVNNGGMMSPPPPPLRHNPSSDEGSNNPEG